MWCRRLKGAFGYLSPLFLTTFFATGCATQAPLEVSPKHPPEKETRKVQVHATAYTSRLKRENAKYPVGAWGDALIPSYRAIAVSDDLIKMGLGYQTRVRIEGFEGEYQVLDRMHPRWKKRIDLYMGDDIQRAREWGIRTVTIGWEHAKDQKGR